MEMKQTKSILVSLLLGMVMAGCGLADLRVEKIQSRHPGWDQATVKAVAERKVHPGMTKSMVMEAIGNPDSINQEGSEEKWTYGINRERDMGAIVRKPVFWVYFKGEKVVKTTGDWGKLGYKFYGW